MLGPVLAQLTPGLEVVGGELAVFQADDLGQILAQQAERPPDGDDVHGHEQLVQDQDARLKHKLGLAFMRFLSKTSWWRRHRRRVSNASLLPKDAPGRGQVRGFEYLSRHRPLRKEL